MLSTVCVVEGLCLAYTRDESGIDESGIDESEIVINYSVRKPPFLDR